MKPIDQRREVLESVYHRLGTHCKAHGLDVPRSGGWPHQELGKVLCLVEHLERLLVKYKKELEDLKNDREKTPDVSTASGVLPRLDEVL